MADDFDEDEVMAQAAYEAEHAAAMEDEYNRAMAEEQDRARERGPGCLFPGKCCMPGPHDMSECHTADMIEQFNREQRRGGQERA